MRDSCYRSGSIFSKSVFHIFTVHKGEEDGPSKADSTCIERSPVSQMRAVVSFTVTVLEKGRRVLISHILARKCKLCTSSSCSVEDLGWIVQFHHELHSLMHATLNWNVMRWQSAILQKQTQLLCGGIILLQDDKSAIMSSVIYWITGTWKFFHILDTVQTSHHASSFCFLTSRIH
jgi:hypothetical protein